MISIPSAEVQSVCVYACVSACVCVLVKEGEGWNHNTDDEMTPNILWRAIFDSLHIFLNSDKYIQKRSLYSISSMNNGCYDSECQSDGMA